MDFDDAKEYQEYLKTVIRLEQGTYKRLDNQALKKIARDIEIPKNLVRIQYSRSRGSGGQHVNTTESRATIFFNVDSGLLNEQIRINLNDLYSNQISQ